MDNVELLKVTLQEIKELNHTMGEISDELGKISASLLCISKAFQEKKLYICGEVTNYLQ